LFLHRIRLGVQVERFARAQEQINRVCKRKKIT
jgi:hypothetical protein